MIGIVGGMGPLAGLDVFKKITEETPVTSDQEHAPVLLFSVPAQIPDRSEFLLGREKTNPAIAISEIILTLEKAGARVVGIPCNTAHSPRIFDVITAELHSKGSRVLLLNLIEVATEYVNLHFSGKKIGVLSTTGTRKTSLYKNALDAFGLVVIEPDDDWQERVHAAAYDPQYGIKAGSFPINEKATAELHLAVAHLKAKGAEVILLGCTEIPLALIETELEGLPLIDANRLLAKQLLRSLSFVNQ